MTHDAQRTMKFDPRPNRPNNWFLADVQRAMQQARLAETLKRRGPNVGWLLTCIVTREHELRYQQTPHFTERQLAELTNIPKTTIREVVKAAVNAGWLLEVPTGNSGAWYRVQIPAGLVPVTTAVQFTEPSGPDTPSTGPEPDQNRTGSGPELDQNRTILDPRSQSLPPSPPGSCAGAGGGDLQELVEALRRLGVRLASATARRALSQGRTVDEVRARIRHFEERPGAWGAGALCYVLTCPDYVGSPVDDWPEPDAAWVKSQALAAQQDAERREAEQRKQQELQAEAKRRAERDELRQLELGFGDAVDGLSHEEQCQLLPEPFQHLFSQLLKKGEEPSRSTWIRPALLRAFAARASEN